MKSKIATIIMDLHTNSFIDCNEAALRINGLKNETELIGKSLFDFAASDSNHNKELLSYIEEAITYGYSEFEWEFKRPNREIWDGQVNLATLKYDNKELLQISMKDITEYKRTQKIFLLTNAELRNANEQLAATEEELRMQFEELEYIQKESKAREEMYRNLIENINCVVYEFDYNRILTYVSPVAKDILGYEPRELEGMDFFKIIHPRYKKYLYKLFNDISQGIKGLSEDYLILTKSGDYKWVKSINKIFRHENKFLVRGVLFDIHEQKMYEEKINYLGSHDLLTGVYNRSYFEEKLLEYDKLENLHPISMLIADINGLKDVNNKFGQESGNKLLINAVNVIKKLVSKQDIVARIGGDEFAVLLPNRDEEDAQALITQIKKGCQRVDEDGITLSISIGTATKYSTDENIYNTMFLSEERMYNKKLLESKSYRSHLIESLMNVMSEKTFETKEHCQRLASLSKKVAEQMNLQDDQIEKLKVLSLMHDIGKIAVPEYILAKPELLNYEEWVEMKKHTEIGYRIAKKTPEFSYIADEILSHHERWDGKGYPQGLKGTEIPLESRILAVVDAFDAMTSDRVYRKAMSIDEAIEELMENAGTQFDPFIVDVFVNKIIRKS